MLHAVFIAAHAASGLVALAPGLIQIHPHTQDVSTVFRLYLGTLWLMILFLIAVVWIDWINLDQTSRIVFGALMIFAFYVGWRGLQALQNLCSQSVGWKESYVENVGFTLIALFDGFIVIGPLDLNAPIWPILLIGALGVLVGRSGVGRTRRHIAA